MISHSKFQLFLQFILLISLALAQDAVQVQTKLQDYQEGIRDVQFPGSRVTITVGEHEFLYQVDGQTESDEKVAVSGDYFNDEINHDGFARLALVVESGIAYYQFRPYGNRLDIYVENYRYDDFTFQVHTPHPLSAYDLQAGQINATAILVTGYSRSAILHK